MDFISAIPFKDKSLHLGPAEQVTWKPSVLLHNILAVEQAQDVASLYALLLEAMQYEKALITHIPKGQIAVIKERASQLSLLSHLVDKIHARLCCSQSPSILAANIPLAGGPASPHQPMLDRHALDNLQTTYKTDSGYLEWSANMIGQKEKLLNYLSDDEVRQLSMQTVHQICVIWTKQKNKIDALKQEQFGLTSLALIRMLKNAILHQIQTIKYSSAADSQKEIKIKIQSLQAASSNSHESEHDLFGLESASEKDMDSLPFEEDGQQILKVENAYPPSLGQVEYMDCSHARVLQELSWVSSEKNFTHLEQCLLLIDRAEMNLSAKMIKSDLRQIKEHAQELNILLEAIDMLCERYSYFWQKKAAQQTVDKPTVKNLWSSLWSWTTLFQAHKKENKHLKSMPLEGSLAPLLQQIRSLKEARTAELQACSLLIVDQLMASWCKQQKEISKLEHELLCLTNFSLLKLLKFTVIDQMKMVTSAL